MMTTEEVERISSGTAEVFANPEKVIRFWELNINKNMDIIEEFILNLKNLECYEKGIKEIKEYYLQNS